MKRFKRKLIKTLIFLGALIGFGACSYNGCENISRVNILSVEKPKNAQRRNANVNMSKYDVIFSINSLHSDLMIIDLYQNQLIAQNNFDFMIYNEDNNTYLTDNTISGELSNDYYDHSLVFAYVNDSSNFNVWVITWNNNNFNIYQVNDQFDDTIISTNNIKISLNNFDASSNYQIASRVVECNQLLDYTDCTNYISNNVYYNHFHEYQIMSLRLANLNTQISNLNEEIDNLNEELADATNTIQNYEDDIRNYQARIGDLNSQITILQNGLDTAVERENELINEIVSLEHALSTAQSNLSNAENRLAETQEELRIKGEQLAEAQAELQENIPHNIISWIKIFARGFESIFNIEMLPGFKVGYMIVAPLLIGIVSLFFKMIRGA